MVRLSLMNEYLRLVNPEAPKKDWFYALTSYENPECLKKYRKAARERLATDGVLQSLRIERLRIPKF